MLLVVYAWSVSSLFVFSWYQNWFPILVTRKQFYHGMYCFNMCVFDLKGWESFDTLNIFAKTRIGLSWNWIWYLFIFRWVLWRMKTYFLFGFCLSQCWSWRWRGVHVCGGELVLGTRFLMYYPWAKWEDHCHHFRPWSSWRLFVPWEEFSEKVEVDPFDCLGKLWMAF